MKKVCSTCGGSGQVGYFQGESRFLLSWEECPRCCGTGLADHAEGEQKKETRDKENRSRKKKKNN